MPKLVIHSILNRRWNKLACINYYNKNDHSNSSVNIRIDNCGQFSSNRFPSIFCRFQVGNNEKFSQSRNRFLTNISGLSVVQCYFSTDSSTTVNTGFKKFSSSATGSADKLDASDDKASSSSDSSYAKEAEQMEKERQEKYEKTWSTIKYTLIGVCSMVAMGTVAIIWGQGSPRYDDQGHIIIDQFSHLPTIQQYLYRAWNEFYLFVKSVPEPSREKLLPDPLREPYYQPKYTVVFEIAGVMVHPDWTFNTGWRFKKRPAVEYFLKTLGYPRTELVVYTTEQGMTAHPIIEHLDPENVIMYRLYRDTTKYQIKDGSHIKDLSKLNRDLSKVIYIDWDNKAFQLNPENALRIPKWTGDDDDTGLIDLANLIRAVIDSDVEDVRPILQYYSSCNDPLTEFRENQRKLLQMEESKMKAMRQHDDSLTKNWGGKLFGYRRH